MAFGLLLWGCCISLLLNCSPVSSGPKVDYRLAADSKNLVDDETGFPSVLTLDEGEMEGSSDSKRWVAHLFGPSTFPESSGNQIVVTQYKPAAVMSSTSPVSSTGSMSVSPNALVSGHASQMFHNPAQAILLPGSASSETSYSAGTGSDGMTLPASGHPTERLGNLNFVALNSERYGQSNNVAEPSLWYVSLPQTQAINAKPAQSYAANMVEPSSQGTGNAGSPTWYAFPPQKPAVNAKPNGYAANVVERPSQESGAADSLTQYASLPQKPAVNVGKLHWYSSPTNDLTVALSKETPSAFGDWMSLSDVFGDWNNNFIRQLPQNMVTRTHMELLPKRSHKKRVVQSKRGYKRGRVTLSKASYVPAYEVSTRDAKTLKPFKMPVKNQQAAH